MPASADIYGMVGRGVRPVEDPQNALLKALQVQGAMQDRELGSMKMDEYRRGVERSNKLQQLLAGDYADDDARAGALVKGGFLKEGQDLLKGRADIKKINSDAKKTDVEILDKSLGVAKSFVSQVQTPEQAAAYLEGLYSDPVLGPIAARLSPKEMALQNIPKDPAQLMRWKAGHMAMSADKLMELSLPKLQTNNVGNAQVTTGYDQFTGKPIEGAGQTQTIFQSPDNAATNLTSTENNKRTVAASLENAKATRDAAATGAQATRDAANIQTGFKNEQAIREEFNGLPEVKTYKQAYPTYAAIVDAAKRNTPQSDINLVYGIAKLYDPNSVVREGEYATVANSPNIPERIKGYAQYLAGGGRLSANTKAQIVAEAKGRMGTYQGEHDKARSSYEAIAKQRGMDPTKVLPAMGDAPAGAVRAGNAIDFGSLK